MAFGVTDQGFVAKTSDEIKADIEAALKASFGQGIDLTPQSNFGQFVGLMTERFADMWAMGEADYAVFDPDNATGAGLDMIAGLTGTTRLGATQGHGTVTAIGDTATVLEVGRVVSVDGAGTRFDTTEEVTIAAAPVWVLSTAYVEGNLVSNGSPVRVFRCTVGGVSNSSGGPNSTGAAITDNTVTWEYLGDGDGFIDVKVEAEETGALVGNARTIKTIETAVLGWNAVINLEDITPGQEIEKDAALRLRREQELRAPGNAQVDAIRNEVLDVKDVTSCTVFENITDVTDADSIPPHAIRVLVQGGDDQLIAQAIFRSKAGGIATDGSSSQSVTDSQGNTRTISFSRPTTKNLYVRIDLTYDATLYPADGDAQVKAAVVAFGALSKTGKDAVSASIGAQAFKVAGVLDTPVVYIKKDSGPPTTSTTVAISKFELAVFDTSRITINSSAGTP